MIQSSGGPSSITGSLDLSSLAKISDGYSAGHIEKSVTAVLSERRVQQVRLQQQNLYPHSLDLHSMHFTRLSLDFYSLSLALFILTLTCTV